jgi:hypothetical protein
VVNAVLNRANKNKLKEAVTLIGAVLASAESAEEELEDDADDKSQPPNEIISKESLVKLEALVKAFDKSIAKIEEDNEEDDESGLEEKASDEINLEELELPQKKEEKDGEVDLEMLSKVLVTLKTEQINSIKEAVKSELRKATGVVD